MKIQKLFLAALLVMVLTFAVLTCTQQSGTWSRYEKRALAEKPQVDLAGLLSGKTAAQTEAYLSDHLYARERMLRLRARVLAAIGKPVVNSVVLTDTALLPQPLGKSITDIEVQNAEKIAKALSLAQKQTEQFGGTFLYVLVAEQRSALREGYPDWLAGDGEYLDACAELLLAQLQKHGVRYLDLRKTLRENAAEYYYKTDHHYSLQGAYAVYRAICRAVSLPAAEIQIEKTNCILTGTYACKLFGTNPLSDPYEIYMPTVPFSREDNGQISDKPLFAEPGDQTMYDAYMGGDFGQTILHTHRQALPDALIVGNSFTNALETILYQNFNDTRSLDFRHYYASNLTEYIAAQQPQYVFVVCDDQSCLTSSGNNLLQ